MQVAHSANGAKLQTTTASYDHNLRPQPTTTTYDHFLIPSSSGGWAMEPNAEKHGEAPTPTISPNASPANPVSVKPQTTSSKLSNQLAVKQCLECLGIQQFCHATQGDLERYLTGLLGQEAMTKDQALHIYTLWLAEWIPYENYKDANFSSSLVHQWCRFVGPLGIPKRDILNCFAKRKQNIIKASAGAEPARKRIYNFARRDIEIHLKVKRPETNKSNAQAQGKCAAKTCKSFVGSPAYTTSQVTKADKGKLETEAIVTQDSEGEPANPPPGHRLCNVRDHASQTMPCHLSTRLLFNTAAEEKIPKLPEWRKRALDEGFSTHPCRKKNRMHSEAPKPITLSSLSTQQVPPSYICKRCNKKGEYWLLPHTSPSTTIKKRVIFRTSFKTKVWEHR
jgi:hypothetical protein